MSKFSNVVPLHEGFSTAGRLSGSRSMQDRLFIPYAAQTGAQDTLPSISFGTSRLYELTVGQVSAASAGACRSRPATKCLASGCHSRSSPRPATNRFSPVSSD